MRGFVDGVAALGAPWQPRREWGATNSPALLRLCQESPGGSGSSERPADPWDLPRGQGSPGDTRFVPVQGCIRRGRGSPVGTGCQRAVVPDTEALGMMIRCCDVDPTAMAEIFTVIQLSKLPLPSEEEALVVKVGDFFCGEALVCIFAGRQRGCTRVVFHWG